MNNHDVCLQLAKEIREKIDKAVKNRSKCFDLFYEDLMGVCAIASIALQKSLKKRKILSEVYCGKFVDKYEEEHCWVVHDGKSYDITATQFKRIRKKVYVLDTKKEAYNKKYRDGKKILSLSDFKSWPDEQKPSKKAVECIMV